VSWNNATKDPLNFDASNEFDKINRVRYDYCIKLAKTFNSDIGKEILKNWRENTIESSAWSAALAQQVGLEAANAHAYAREGQNAFVRDIEESILVAEEYKTFESFSDRTNLS